MGQNLWHSVRLHRTLMRHPRVKGQPPPESGFFLFFRFPGSGAISSRARVLTRFLCTGASQRDCPTHVLRVDRHLRGHGRDPLGVSSATEKSCRTLLPSYSQGWLNVSSSPVSVGLGGGAGPVT
jgi:hypothetical protein